jgi:hypothetical protein
VFRPVADRDEVSRIATKRLTSILNDTGCLKIREFRIQSVVGKDPVELENYKKKQVALSEEDISTLILFNT